MGDSDDEYDRKRRDKFRGERSADTYRSERRDERSRGRDDWPDRGRGRPDYRDYRPVRDRYSPGREAPPVKRMRGDWGDDRPRYGGHEPYGPYVGHPYEPYPIHGGHGFGGHPPGVALHGVRNEPPVNPDIQTQPQMMTLKQFLATQDDSISDSDAIAKYNDYKLEFKRQQLNEFFVAHKDEEWFKIKYHPEDSSRRREEQLNYLKNRVEVFAELLEKELITNINVDTTQTEQLLRLLDTVVIKLEGGTDEDLKILDESPIELQQIILPKNGEKIDITKDDDDDDKKDDSDVQLVTEIIDGVEDWDKEDEIIKEKIVTPQNDKNDVVNEVADENDDREENVETKTKRKRSHSESSSSSSSSSDSDEDKIDDKPDEEEIEDNKSDVKSPTSPNKQDGEIDDEENSTKDAPAMDIDEQPKDEDSIVSKNDAEEESNEKIDELDNKPEETINSVDLAKDEEKDDKQIVEENPETIDLDKEKDPKEDENLPRALHKTSSIFLRNLAPTITKAEVEAICKKYDGFLRVAIADPLGERRWFRRGWVTFRRDVNKKEICWNLNNMRLRDCELGAIVNRDLSRRVRPVNGITAHKTVLRSDIKLCAKIAHNLDEKSGLWRENFMTSGILDKITKHQNNESFGLNSKNPVLQNITDYLIEEASAEEDELLGLSENDNKENIDGEVIERDPQLLSVLDKLILYLRIVHSVDFYNHCEYPYEDEMPNRCGIIHARGPPPQKVTYQEIQDYIRNFEAKMISFLSKNTTIEEDELKKLGAKDCEAEVEKFVQSNTQELSKDKWLCPLSGKKFKGPEFIQKHIFNKHGEKVDEVRKEVEYFNNYLKDAKRPQLPEHPGTNKKPNEIIPAAFRQGYPGPPAYGGPPYGGYAPPAAIAPPRIRPGYGPRRGMGAEYRPIIHYRDLDAPREPDEFI